MRSPCPTARQVRLPWAESHARFTLLFERLASRGDTGGTRRTVSDPRKRPYHVTYP